MYVCVCACLSVCLSLCLSVCMYVCMCACLSVCLYVCMYVCMFVYGVVFIKHTWFKVVSSYQSSCLSHCCSSAHSSHVSTSTSPRPTHHCRPCLLCRLAHRTGLCDQPLPDASQSAVVARAVGDERGTSCDVGGRRAAGVLLRTDARWIRRIFTAGVPWIHSSDAAQSTLPASSSSSAATIRSIFIIIIIIGAST